MKHILSALAIVCMMIVEQAHAQGLQPKSFFPKEARTVDEVCAMMTTSNTEEMVLFRKMVIELLSSPALTDRNMNEREVINYLRQHLSVRPASQVIYSGARPINAREVVAIGRFPEDEIGRAHV